MKFLLFERIKNSKPVTALTLLVKKIKLPGFNGLPLWDVAVFFFRRFNENELQTRARAIAFSLFLALFPTIIFLFTLIPYVPIENFQLQVLLFIREFLPSTTYESVYSTIEDIVSHQRGGLLSFGFLFALIISSDGILNLMLWFNKSFHGKMQRSKIKQRLIAISITVVLALFTLMAILLIILNEVAISFLVEHKVLMNSIQIYFIQTLKWIIILALSFSGISLLYYFGPSERNKLSFINAGSSLATLLLILTSLAFNYFLNNWAQYNKVYGSIGTLIIFLIWIYLNSFVLLVGYELNVSINHASEHIKNNKLKA